MNQIAETIEAQLTSANQRTPDPEVVETWLIDLQNRLGAISTDRLERAFTAAREECAERRARGQFGQLSLDDVIRQRASISATISRSTNDDATSRSSYASGGRSRAGHSADSPRMRSNG